MNSLLVGALGICGLALWFRLCVLYSLGSTRCPSLEIFYTVAPWNSVQALLPVPGGHSLQKVHIHPPFSYSKHHMVVGTPRRSGQTVGSSIERRCIGATTIAVSEPQRARDCQTSMWHRGRLEWLWTQYRICQTFVLDEHASSISERVGLYGCVMSTRTNCALAGGGRITVILTDIWV